MISYEEYHPYGTTSYQASQNSADVGLKRYRYTGKEKDDETGLYYHGARYYACWLARWTAADPAGLMDGDNLYFYVQGNPVFFVDSTGFNREGWSEIYLPGDNSGAKTYVKESTGTLDRVSPHGGRDVWDPVNKVWIRDPEKDDGVTVEINTPLVVTGNDKPKQKPKPKKDQPNVLDEVFQGDFYEGETTVLGTVASVGLGFVPGLGQAQDFRDTMALIDRIRRGEDVSFWDVALNVVGYIPGGDIVKGIKKGAPHVADALKGAGKSLASGPPPIPPIKKKPKKRASAPQKPTVVDDARRSLKKGQPLSSDMKDALRSEAKNIFEQKLGKRLPDGYQAHHIIPLQFAHLFPELDPNDLRNLVAIPDHLHNMAHSQLIEKIFNQLKKDTKIPVTRKEVLDVVRQANDYLSIHADTYRIIRP